MLPDQVQLDITISNGKIGLTASSKAVYDAILNSAHIWFWCKYRPLSLRNLKCSFGPTGVLRNGHKE